MGWCPSSESNQELGQLRLNGKKRTLSSFSLRISLLKNETRPS